MKLRIISLSLVFLFMEFPVLAQSFPISTASDEAKQIFLEYGWDNAFNFQEQLHLETMDNLIAMDSTFALAYLHRGGYSPLHVRKRYFELAKENMSHITEDERKLVDAFYAFMWDYDQLEAVKILKDLAEKYPNQPHFPAYIGIRYRNRGEYDKAIPYFQEALNRDPNFTPAYQLLGLMHSSLGNYDKAEQNFRTYKEREPEFWRGDINLGLLFLRQGNLEEAKKYFNNALAKSEGQEIRDLIGYYYLMTNNLEKAKAMFEENLRLNPSDPNSYSSMGDWYFEQEKYGKAAEWYEKALGYKPLNTSARNYYNNMVESQVRHSQQSFENVIRQKNFDSLVDYFTVNAQLITTEGETIEGPEEIADWWKAEVAEGLQAIDLNSRTVIASQDQFFATEIGQLETKFKGSTQKLFYTAIWRNNSDRWKIHYLMMTNKKDE